jgi:prolipoprotein diacylglyceryltransferase
MYKIRQQRKSDVMTSFGHTARSAVYYNSRFPIHPLQLIFAYIKTCNFVLIFNVFDR